MRALKSKDRDILSPFHEIDESQANIHRKSVKDLLNDNHGVAADKDKIKGQLLLEQIFGFCQTFKKISKQLKFHIISLNCWSTRYHFYNSGR